MKRVNEVLLIIAAITSVVFLFIVEYFNDLTLDDLGFALLLRKEGVWQFIIDVYSSWQGRFMGFLITGFQIKSYFLFNSMIPFSIVLYVLNIFLVSKALVNFFNLTTLKSILLAIVFFQLYVYSMLDISSYFWLCTKGYTLIISISLFALSLLTVPKRSRWYDYPLLFIVFAFLGCSYEIYAPVLILFMGSILLYSFHKSGYNIGILISENRKFAFSFAICILFFSLMVIAPGNWIRMSEHTKDSSLLFGDFLIATGKNNFHLAKLLLLKIPYFLSAGFLLWVIMQQVSNPSKLSSDRRSSLKRIILYLLSCFGLCFFSIVLNTYAVGPKMALRAFNHINLICFLLIGFSIYEFPRLSFSNKLIAYLLPLFLVFIIFCNTYNSYRSVPELRGYKESAILRMAELEIWREKGNKETVKLQPLKHAEYHSVDDIWKVVIPRFSHRVLLKPNEISNSSVKYYNKTYREYYKLDFDVVTEPSSNL